MRPAMLGLFVAVVFSACGGDDSTSSSGGAGGTSGSDASTTGGTAGSAGTLAGGAGGSAGTSTGGSAGVDAAVTSATGTLVPLYSYPTDATWTAIVAGKAAHPSVPIVAVVNPDSGPGTAKDTIFVTGTDALAKAGVVVIGYVATGYASRDAVTEVQPEIDRYLSWYPAVTGIFFDEQSADSKDVAYYSGLSAYAKGKGLGLTVGNPGADTDESYVGALDVMLIYESKGLPTDAALGGWHAKYDKSSFGIIPYGVSLDTAFVTKAKSAVGWVYLTDDDLPNPWDTLPPYFDGLLSALE
jgi:hypothetical protein